MCVGSVRVGPVVFALRPVSVRYRSSVFGRVRECSGRFGRASGSPRARSVAAPGRTRSGAPDAEVYASPRTNRGSAHPLALDAGKHLSACWFVADDVQWPPQLELGQGHLTPSSTFRRGPIMGAPIHWHSTWGTTSPFYLLLA